MAIGYYFFPKGMTPGNYDESTARLEQAGQGSPDGRIVHIAFEGQGGMNVFDVWESEEKFEAFGQVLMPILAEFGIDAGEPKKMEIHNLIKG